jgi:hypothetical protein
MLISLEIPFAKGLHTGERNHQNTHDQPKAAPAC